MEHSEGFVVSAVLWLKLALELVGALIVAVGAGIAIARLARGLVSKSGTSFTGVRLGFARYLALALEFQLGADILATSVSPGWEQLLELAVIATIRTALNFFLAREMKEEAAEQAMESRVELEAARGAA